MELTTPPSFSIPDVMEDQTPNPKWGFDLTNFDVVFYFENLNSTTGKWSDDPAFYPTTIVYSLAFILGIFGNALVVYGLLLDKKAHNVTNTFLVSLAVADLLFLILVVPYEMGVKFAGYWTGVQVFCKLSAYVEMLTAAASIWNLTAVSIERYIVIVHPFKSRTICSLGNTKKIIGVVWFVAVLLSIPCLLVYGTKVNFFFNDHTYTIDFMCTIKVAATLIPAVAWYQFLVMFLIPTVIMIFCYSLVIKVLWKSTRNLAKMTHTNNRSHEEVSLTKKITPIHKGQSIQKTTPIHSGQSTEMMEARKQVIKMLLTIIMVFLFCWGPKLILLILKAYGSQLLHNTNAFVTVIIINLLPFVQSISNPIIYSFMSNNFRQSMRNAFNSCHRNKSKSDTMRLENYKIVTYNSTALHNSQVTNYTCDF